MTNLLQSATFPGITHKFLDLFASSKKNKKNALLSCVDSTLFPLYIYIYIYIYSRQFSPKKKKKKLLPSSTPHLLPTDIPITTHLFFLSLLLI